MTIKHLKIILTVCVFGLLLQGCVAAVGTGVAVATKMVTDPRTIGTQVDDETLEEKVLFSILKDQQLKKEARINVVSYSGRVLLIGQVPNGQLKQLAEQLAEGVEGVKHIYNELRIGKPIGFGQISKDGWLTTQVKMKIFADSAGVNSRDVKVISENNEVFLMGNLTVTQANAAAEAARNISGVAGVIKAINYVN